jgi:hypothetical protein
MVLRIDAEGQHIIFTGIYNDHFEDVAPHLAPIADLLRFGPAVRL